MIAQYALQKTKGDVNAGMLTTEHNVLLQAPPTLVAPERLNNELRSEIESKTVNRLLHLLYFSQVICICQQASWLFCTGRCL